MEAVATNALSAHWTSRAAAIFWRFWKIKFAGSVAFAGLFFLGYFALLKHPTHIVTTMPVMALDEAIPFQPQTIWIYVSLWFYLELAPSLLESKREILSYGIALTLMTVCAFAIFYFWPTRVPAFPVDWSEYTMFSWLKQTDAAGNACPSLHVAFAVFTARWVHFIFKRMRANLVFHVLNWTWAVAIVYSTISTRQHVAIDVLAGAALGVIASAIHLSWTTSHQPEFS
ncbi:MAG TPA: phosphatase PAP2 family protein [Opitutaceae bacterium]